MATSSIINTIIGVIFWTITLCPVVVRGVELPPEKPLWPDGKLDRGIEYEQAESVRSPQPPASSPSGSNRVFRYVSRPTYSIHRASQSTANGVGLVICPGGAYREVWLDREGHDLGIWLKQRGVTSLVLKYRTNAGAFGQPRKYPWEQYLPAVEADAREALRILRRQAGSLNVDPQRIGICGFSAGGNLALLVALSPGPKVDARDVSGHPNFAGLFYPWLREEYGDDIKKNADQIPPLFIMNAGDDNLTPAARCVDFYAELLNAGVKAELHIFGIGKHGFDLGDGRGASAAIWKDSFIAWLSDARFIE